MRIKTLVVASAMAMAVWPSHAQLESTAVQRLQVLTLAEVWRLAEDANPTLRAKRAELSAAEGALKDANAPLFNNPVVSVDRTRRNVPQDGLPTERRREWALDVQQTLEIAGQRGYRRQAADGALTALQSEILDVQAQVRIEVAQAYYRVLVLQQRIELEREALVLFDATAQAVEKRRSAGEDTKLDANVAVVESERARNQLAIANELLIDARSDLASRLQLSPERLPAASGEARPAPALPYDLDRLLASAEAQPRLAALRSREDSARARLRLEDASRYPDVTVGLSTGREGSSAARERLTTLTVSVPLPLFRRNASGIGQASTALAQAEISRSATVRDVRAQVLGLWAKLQSLKERIDRLQGRVLPALLDNLQLSVKSQRAGQIGLLELIVVNRQALDARRDLLDALNDYQSTRLALELAAGWNPEGASK